MNSNGMHNTMANDLVMIHRNATDEDLSGVGLAGVQGKGLIVQFFYEQIHISSIDPVENGKVVTRLCIAKKPRGDKFTIAVGTITPEQAQRQFPREYAMFMQYDEAPTTGTPLHELPGLSQSQIGMLVINGLRSVEDLVGIPQDAAYRIGRDAVRAQKIAQHWLERNEAEAESIKAAEIEANYQAKAKADDDRLKAMEDQNRYLQAQVDFLTRATAASSAAPMPGANTMPGTIPSAVAEVMPGDDPSYDPFMTGSGVVSVGGEG